MKLSINADITERLNTEDMPDVLTVHEVSELLGICRVSVCKQIALGNIAAFKKGRNKVRDEYEDFTVMPLYTTIFYIYLEHTAATTGALWKLL